MVDYEKALIKHRFKYKKSLGQNFIFDSDLLGEIAEAGGADKSACVVEIGAGAGSLTRELCKRAQRVISFEVDETLFPVLSETLDGFDNLSLLNFDVNVLGAENVDALVGEDYIVIANLPYYITTPLIYLFLRAERCKAVTALVQKEVAERICAERGGDYGYLSASVQAVGDPKLLRVIKSWDFYPQPEVDSALLKITKRDAVYSDKLDAFFKNCFIQKRKTLVNNLSAYSKQKLASALAELGFAPTARAEELGTKNLIELGRRLGVVSEE